MNKFPWSRILEFLRTVSPFDTLSEEELNRVVLHMEIAYYPHGKVISRRGDKPPGHLHVVRTGSARITIPDDKGEEMLVDMRGEGDVFGAASLLQGKEALFNITAHEDIIAYLLPAKQFKQLVNIHPIFERYFSFSLARVFEGASRSNDQHLSRMIGTSTLDLDTVLINRRVSDLMVPDVLTCEPGTSIRMAARRMTERGAGSIVITYYSSPVGIITDTDLRVKVVTQGLDFDTPVEKIMNPPVCRVLPQDSAFDALLEMSRHGVNHLLVMENERLVGIISDHDLQMEIGSSPVGLIHDLEKAQSVDELSGLRPKMDRALEMLLRRGGTVKKIMELGTRFNDSITMRLIQLAEREIEDEGMGGPPSPYCWMVLGSQGRQEQSLPSDQYNALMFSDLPSEKEAGRWFITFSERVVEGLVRCGFPRGPGDIMASNPQWCRKESQWRDIFLGWVNDPEPLTLRMAGIFIDFRPLYTTTNFPEVLRKRLNEAIHGSSRFLSYMAANSLHNRPPMGFLRQFVLDKSGEHKSQLNLKQRGTTPIVDSTRVLALDLKINTTNTLERLDEIKRQNIIEDTLAADLKEAYSFITLLRITRNLADRDAGMESDDLVDPGTLNSFQRKMLKESFIVIDRLQEILEHRYQTRFVMEA